VSNLHPAIMPICLLLAFTGSIFVGVATYRHYREKSVIEDVRQRYGDYKKKNGMSDVSEWSNQQMKAREAEIRFEAEMNRVARSLSSD